MFESHPSFDLLGAYCIICQDFYRSTPDGCGWWQESRARLKQEREQIEKARFRDSCCWSERAIAGPKGCWDHFVGFSPDCFDAWLIVNILDPTMSDLDSVSGNRQKT